MELFSYYKPASGRQLPPAPNPCFLKYIRLITSSAVPPAGTSSFFSLKPRNSVLPDDAAAVVITVFTLVVAASMLVAVSALPVSDWLKLRVCTATCSSAFFTVGLNVPVF